VELAVQSNYRRIHFCFVPGCRILQVPIRGSRHAVCDIDRTAKQDYYDEGDRCGKVSLLVATQDTYFHMIPRLQSCRKIIIEPDDTFTNVLRKLPYEYDMDGHHHRCPYCNVPVVQNFSHTYMGCRRNCNWGLWFRIAAEGKRLMGSIGYNHVGYDLIDLNYRIGNTLTELLNKAIVRYSISKAKRLP
jgi:hypothetical protein